MQPIAPNLNRRPKIGSYPSNFRIGPHKKHPRPLKHNRYNPFKRGGGGVTVCVAAICEGGQIIGASDRMLTSGDIEFEPSQAKVWQFTSSIYALVAGDAAVQTEILQKLHNEVQRRVVATPNIWWSVQEVAELYRQHYVEIRLRRAEGAILAPLGLDITSFLARQRQMDHDLLARIARELREFCLAPTQAIFIGTDNDGPPVPTGQPMPVYSHIWVADGPDLSCRDSIGFAAIGIGQFHAESHLMFSGHTRRRPFPETLLSVYSAKKRAEVAPGVGKDTDMVSIGPGLGVSFTFFTKVIDELEETYQRNQKAVYRTIRNAESRIEKYLEELKTKLPESQVPRQSIPEALEPHGDSTRDQKPQPPSPESRGESGES